MVSVEIAIYLTQEAYNQHGTAPADNLYQAFNQILPNLGYSVTVHTPNNRFVASTENPQGGLYGEWKNAVNTGEIGYASADSNLLLSNWGSLGYASIPGDAAVAGTAPQLANLQIPVQRYGPPNTGPDYYGIDIAFQETWHNCDAVHLDGDTIYDSSDAKYTVSPMLASHKSKLEGQDNNCGNYITTQQSSGYDTYFTPCAQQAANAYLS